jgi:hypothetical protein
MDGALNSWHDAFLFLNFRFDSIQSLDFKSQQFNGNGETGSGDMKHGKSRVPAAFPGEK